MTVGFQLTQKLSRKVALQADKYGEQAIKEIRKDNARFFQLMANTMFGYREQPQLKKVRNPKWLPKDIDRSGTDFFYHDTGALIEEFQSGGMGNAEDYFGKPRFKVEGKKLQPDGTKSETDKNGIVRFRYKKGTPGGLGGRFVAADFLPTHIKINAFDPHRSTEINTDDPSKALVSKIYRKGRKDVAYKLSNYRGGYWRDALYPFMQWYVRFHTASNVKKRLTKK